MALAILEAITAVSECLTNAIASDIRTHLPPDLFYWHPYYNKGYNLVNYLLQATKVISHVLLILFIPSLNFDVSSTQAHNLISIHNTQGRRNHHHRYCSPCSEFDCCTSLDRLNGPQDGYEFVLVCVLVVELS